MQQLAQRRMLVKMRSRETGDAKNKNRQVPTIQHHQALRTPHSSRDMAPELAATATSTISIQFLTRKEYRKRRLTHRT
jgi:hypothetical protein